MNHFVAYIDALNTGSFVQSFAFKLNPNRLAATVSRFVTLKLCPLINELAIISIHS